MLAESAGLAGLPQQLLLLRVRSSSSGSSSSSSRGSGGSRRSQMSSMTTATAWDTLSSTLPAAGAGEARGRIEEVQAGCAPPEAR